MPSSIGVLKEEYRGPLVNDCSGYFRKIAERLKIQIPQVNADGLIDHISSKWIWIGKGPSAGPTAQSFAKQAYLVVALLKAKDHHAFHFNKRTQKYDIPHPYHSGHLAIVLPAPPSSDYPYVICGSTIPEGKSDGSKKVYEKGKHSPWREIDAPNVAYYRTAEAVLTTPEQDPVQKT
jgi:hypothetical protein